MPYDKKGSIAKALNKIGNDLDSRYGSVAVKGPSELGSGGTPGKMAADDKEKRSSMDDANVLDQIRSYESKLLGRDTQKSAHLTDSAPERSTENQGDGPSEGDEDYPGSMERKGSDREDSFDSQGSATASIEDDDDQVEQDMDVATKEGPFFGYTPQKHKPLKINRGGTTARTGKDIP